MRITLIFLSSLTSLASAALVSSSFNGCALEQSIMEKLIVCSYSKNPTQAREVWDRRTTIIPGMSATDLIQEVCRINGNAGQTLWAQYMSELDPDVAEIVDKNTYDCLKQNNLAV